LGVYVLASGSIIRKKEKLMAPGGGISPDDCPASGLFDHVFCGVGRTGVLSYVPRETARNRSRADQNTNHVQDEDERGRGRKKG
jgi:hypothetical protein